MWGLTGGGGELTAWALQSADLGLGAVQNRTQPYPNRKPLSPQNPQTQNPKLLTLSRKSLTPQPLNPSTQNLETL